MSFQVVTWNVLAQAYVKPERYPNSPPESLEPERRRALLLDRLAGFDADILCLQELEPELFEAIKARLPGYHAAFELRSGKKDGAGIFARSALFELVAEGCLRFEARDPGDEQIALIAELRHENRALAVASTHLRWQRREVSAERHIGRRQMRELLEARRRLADPQAAWLIAGDFNADSQSIVVSEALDAGFRLSCRDQRPWDTCNINRKRRKLDYLLYQPEAFEPAPRSLRKLERDTAMPSLSCPSDHLPLQVDFTLRAQERRGS